MKRWQVMTLDGVQLFIASSTYPHLSRECSPFYVSLTMKSTLTLLLKLSTILELRDVLDIDESISTISEESHWLPRINKTGYCDSQFDCQRENAKMSRYLVLAFSLTISNNFDIAYKNAYIDTLLLFAFIHLYIFFLFATFSDSFGANDHISNYFFILSHELQTLMLFFHCMFHWVIKTNHYCLSLSPIGRYSSVNEIDFHFVCLNKNI